MGGASSREPGPPSSYNVYNQRLDPTNNMPVVANQLPWPGQRELLSTERVPSTIAKGGGGRWVFPSQQMFYNALQRKGKGDDVTEADMPSVIDVHNTMNELTWRQVLIWEKLRAQGRTSQPALVRFLGRPDSLSPRARVRSLTGGASQLALAPPSVHSHLAGRAGATPFDRHDWYVDPGDGQEVRYVIDFYFDVALAGSPDAFHLDVRPAVDSLSSLELRARMGVYVWCAKLGLPCPFTGTPLTVLKT